MQLDNRQVVQEARGLGRSQLSNACSRASSDAGSVLDSLLGTPKHRHFTRTQQQYTLQAVASRLQHQPAESCPVDHHIQNWSSPAVSVHGDIDSHTTRWIEEHVQMEQQDPDLLLQREIDQKKAMQQLSGAVHCLEDKLNAVMTEQFRGWNSWRITSKVHVVSSECTQANSCAAMQTQITAVPTQIAVGPSSGMKAEHMSELQQADSASDSPGHTHNQKGQLECIGQQPSALQQAATKEPEALCKPQACPSNTSSSCSPETDQQVPSPEYSRWMKVLAAVESASMQLKDQAVGCETFTSYAGLLQSRLHSDISDC